MEPKDANPVTLLDRLRQAEAEGDREKAFTILKTMRRIGRVVRSIPVGDLRYTAEERAFLRSIREGDGANIGTRVGRLAVLWAGKLADFVLEDDAIVQEMLQVARSDGDTDVRILAKKSLRGLRRGLVETVGMDQASTIS